MPILVDFSATVLPPMLTFQKDLEEGRDMKKKIDIIRHVCLNSLIHPKKKYTKQYGEMIIAADATDTYWRKKVFKYYKASRKKNRDKSKVDWKTIFDTISTLKQDLYENFPYRVLSVPGAEADDIIGVLTRYFQENETTKVGLFDEPTPVMIVSSDEDNLQLHKYPNVRQWSTKQKKLIKPEINAGCSLIEKICTGDPGDGIPNIMSPDDVFVTEGTRQKSFARKRLAEFYERGIDACANDIERRNYQRNDQLINYNHIPVEMVNKIITIYKESVIKGDRGKIMTYLMKHRCRMLLQNLGDF